MDWSRHGGAVVSPIRLTDGCAGRVALVAGRDNPKGAMVIVANDQAAPVPAPLTSLLDSIQPADAVEILCMQERVFGSSGLPAADVS
jgi:hypothetical protein